MQNLFQDVYVAISLTMIALLVGCTLNEPPIAWAGRDHTVDEGDMVVLLGGAADTDGTIETYRWEQIAGPTVSILNQTHQTTYFVAPGVGGTTALEFRLTVTDDSNLTATDEVLVQVRVANMTPIAQAGPDKTVTGDADAAATDEVDVTVGEYGSLKVALSGLVMDYSTYKRVSAAAITVLQNRGGNSRIIGRAGTNTNGEYAVHVRANPGRLVVNATADGFAPQSMIVRVAEGSKIAADLRMVPVQVVHDFQPEKQAEIRVDGQKVVSLQGNTLVSASGVAASRKATAMVTVLDASNDPTVMPGVMERVNSETGQMETIESFGAINVVLSGANGEPLNVGRGKQARVSIPLASGRRPEDSPASIPLFFWSDAMGYWVEEGTAVLEEIAAGQWAYTGSVGHFSTWNADSVYDSITLSGCVSTQDGKPVANAEVTARGTDYVGDSKATANSDGRFEISVRPDSKLEIFAVAEGPLYSDTTTVSSNNAAMEMDKCLIVIGDQGLRDFPVKIKGKTGSVEICVRDHECEDGDRISVDADGRNVFSGEIDNEWACTTLEVEHGKSYPVELKALNGTGHKGNCSYSDVNTGEIRVTGENTVTQVWRHRGGAGSRAKIIVEPQPTKLIVRDVVGSVLCRSSDWTGPCSAENRAMREKACGYAKERALQIGATIVSECRCSSYITDPPEPGQSIFIIIPDQWKCSVEASKEVVSEDEFWNSVE